MSKASTDFDSPWKDTLEWYFEPFIRLCFPEIHSAIDWSRSCQFLDKELQKVVRDAEIGRRFADKLVQVWLVNGQETWILIHVEVQGKREANFAQRMYTYNHRICDRYNRPVLSLAVLCDGSPRWRPTKFKSNILGCKVKFQFLMVKLLDYKQKWEELEQSDNPFATVIMAHIKSLETRRNQQQRQAWKMSLTRGLYEQGYQRQDVLNLFHFIDWVMKLPKGLEEAFLQEITEYEKERNMPYITSAERIGMERGRQEGRQEEAQKLLLRLLERRFTLSVVPTEVQYRLQKLSVEQLEELLDVALTVDSLEQLKLTMGNGEWGIENKIP
ncbi:MAG: DUF4351 domain-containing protein [Symploca sp. SIO2C1]|nr:DUF4351 domain-containing protein [Symploca sp. SIO2C1]